MKVLIDSQSDQILGFTMFGVMAGEVMATVQVAMLGNCPTPHFATPSLRIPPCWKGSFRYSQRCLQFVNQNEAFTRARKEGLQSKDPTEDQDSSQDGRQIPSRQGSKGRRSWGREVVRFARLMEALTIRLLGGVHFVDGEGDRGSG